MLAVVLVLQPLGPYLHSKRFPVPPTMLPSWLLILKQPGGQSARWLEALQECDFDAQHRAGGLTTGPRQSGATCPRR